MITDELFSWHPANRFRAAEALAPEEKQLLLADWPIDMPQVNGSRNAWLISVGPSPGLGTGRRKPGHESTTTHPLALGEPCAFFKIWNTPVGRNLLEVVRRALQPSDLPGDAAESVFLHMNLDTTLEGEEGRISDDKLHVGLARLRTVVEKVKPRLIATLTKKTYETIIEGVDNGTFFHGTAVGDERNHHRKAGSKHYDWKSCRLDLSPNNAILLTEIMQHPKYATTIRHYDELVGEYLASCVRELITPRNGPSSDSPIKQGRGSDPRPGSGARLNSQPRANY